jgi:hypothetical protein
MSKDCRARYIKQGFRRVTWGAAFQLGVFAMLASRSWNSPNPPVALVLIFALGMFIKTLIDVIGFHPGKLQAVIDFEAERKRVSKLLAETDLPALIADECFLAQVAQQARQMDLIPGSGQLKPARLVQHLANTAAYLEALRHCQMLQLVPDSALLASCDAQYEAQLPLSGCLAYDALADLSRGRKPFSSYWYRFQFAPWRPASQLRYLATLAAICDFFAD